MLYNLRCLQVGRPLTEYWRLPGGGVELWVSARDDGSPPLSAAVAVSVAVEPINSAAPRFVADVYSATVIEEAPAPVDVLTVTAVDLDVGEAGRVTYSLSDDARSGSVFTIDGRTGQIRTATRIDRETTAAYQLIVYAADHVSRVLPLR